MVPIITCVLARKFPDKMTVICSIIALTGVGFLTLKGDRVGFDDIIRRLELGTVIHPKNITADNIVRYVRAMQNSIGSNVESLYKIIEDKVEALEFLIQKDSPVIGIPLSQLKVKPGILIACISRRGRIMIPNGNSSILEGDSVIVVTSHLGFGDIRDILLR